MLTFQRRCVAQASALVAATLLGVACGKATDAPAAQDSTNQGSDADVVARIGSRAITLDEIDRQASASSRKPYQDLYDVRHQVLQQMIAEQLVKQEATTRGVTPEALMTDAISGKVRTVSDADVQAFYTQNQAQMQGRSLQDVAPQIKNYLVNQQTGAAQQAFVRQLEEKAGVRIFLEPPRAEVGIAANDPSAGPADAKVTLVEFSDFQCPFCERVGPTLTRLREDFGNDLRVVFRDYPLPFHQQAQVAAEAAQCANDQGKFWEYHDKLFANQGALAADDLKRHADGLGLDTQAFTACLDSGKFKADVQADYAAGQALGVTGTPAFFINGRFLSGAQPYESFKAIIDEELRN